MKFEGIYTPIITPHAQDGAIDKDAFVEVAEFLINSGVHCIVVGASTGEYYAQTNEERIELMNFASEVINQRTLLMVGTGAIRTQDSVMFALEAKKAGADFLLVNSPPYAVPTELENSKHALQINQAANLPIMLYNYPGRTGTHMGEEFLNEVGKFENFCGIKESSGDIDRVHLLAYNYPNIGLCCGMDDQALEFFAWGARCWVCAGSNFLPKVHIALYKACALEGDYTKGRRIMSAMLPLMWNLEQGGKFVQSVKYGCELAGQHPGPPRLPLQPLTSKEMIELENVISRLNTEVTKILDIKSDVQT